MFPEFNLYSTPLLILTLQGIVFSVLLLKRFFKTKNHSDLFLALILLIVYSRNQFILVNESKK